MRCGNRLRRGSSLRFGVLLLELCITPHNYRNRRHSTPLYTLVQLAVLQRDATASIRNVSDAIVAERRLRLVGSSAHLENACEQLWVITRRMANAATRCEHLVNGEGLGDVNLVAQRFDGGRVVLLRLIPQQTLNRHVQSLHSIRNFSFYLDQHNLLIAVERLADGVVLGNLGFLLLRVVRTMNERRIVALQVSSHARTSHQRRNTAQTSRPR